LLGVSIAQCIGATVGQRAIARVLGVDAAELGCDSASFAGHCSRV
jgi:hypothetical protein